MGEGEGGLGHEVGHEGIVAAGHGEGVAAGGVAHGVVAVDAGEVVRRVGRGGDAEGQAFHDAVGVVTDLGDAVGVHRDGAGLAGDAPFVVIIRRYAHINAVAFEGTADADSDRIVVSVDYAQLARWFVCIGCIGILDIVSIVEGGVVGHEAGGDGKSPAVFWVAHIFEGDGVDGVNGHAVELNGAVALFGEGEGVEVGVDGAEGVAAGEAAGADVAVVVGVLGVGRVEVGPVAEVPALSVVSGGRENEGGMTDGVVVVDGVGAVGVLAFDGQAADFDMRSDDDAVEEHGLDDLVAARHEEVPVAGRLVKGGDGGVGGEVDGDATEGDSVASLVFIEIGIGHHPGVAVLPVAIGWGGGVGT